MKKIIISLALLLWAAPLAAQTPTGEEVLRNIDQNMVVDQAFRVSEMIVHGRTGSRTIKSRTWFKGRDKAFVEYLWPARERGKKMLKLGDKLWNYTPEPNDRIIAIAGHLLRQSVMGSDLSYEDITENDHLAEIYQAVVEGKAEVRGRPCLVLKLTAKKKDVAYHTRKIWVDPERWLPLKEERFARSGRLLKTFEITEVLKIDQRWYPKKMVFKDMLSRGKGTEFILESIDFSVVIPDHRFTKASLRK